MSSVFQLADGGDAQAQNDAGLACETGKGVPRNPDRAAHYYQLSADQRHPEGAYNYARCLQEGVGVRPNQNSAVAYYRIAADCGHVRAACALGKLYQSDRDMRNAAKYLRQAADGGDVEGQYLYGSVLQHDERGGSNRYRDAIRYFRLAADAGSPSAQCALGNLLEKGKGQRQDVRGAVRYYRMAADQGDAQGQYQLGRMHEHGFGMRENAEAAARLYGQAAERGNVPAMLALASVCERTERIEDAMRWLSRAADLNSVQAMTDYARIVEKTNPGEAARVMRRAAELDVDAQVKYGLMVANGIGCQRNDGEAYRIIASAAQRGHPEGLYLLANMLKSGKGCAKNDQEAMRTLEQAAKAGHPTAVDIVSKLRQKEAAEREVARIRQEEEERLQKLHQDRVRPRTEEDETPRRGRRGRGGRGGSRGGGIPTQGLPKPPPQQHQQQSKPPDTKIIVDTKFRGVVVEEGGTGFVEGKEEQQKTKGGPKAQLRLAQHFLAPATKDLTLAYHFMKLAAEREPDAMMQLFDLLSRGEIGEPLGEPKHEAARHYLTCGCRIGHTPAILKLSEIYATGFGTPVDMVESVRYLKMAADAGDGESRFRFSQMLRNGQVVKVNVQLADEYLKKAAQAEWLPAQLDMARKLQAAGDPKFVAYLEAAAENGDDEAVTRLGRIYRFGEGVEVNVRKAKKYLRMAAERGGEEDQRNLAEFLAEMPQRGPQPDE